MNLEEYIEYRTGTDNVLLIVRNMFLKPFMASSLRSFWKYWNPGYGYFLLFYCYKPLRRVFPHWASMIITFIGCGILHDVIYVIPMMLMNNGSIPIPFITVWFLLISLGILTTEYFHLDFRNLSRSLYPFFHISFLGFTFFLTRRIDLLLSI